MNEKGRLWEIIVLLAGDILTLALVTIYGFASHDTLGSAGTRILATFIPLVVGWLAVAPLLGLYRHGIASSLRQAWRPFWAMILGAPLAAWLRGIWLNAAIQPLFVFILGGVAALSILVWRIVVYFWINRRRTAYG
jgi:hypothetical protein